MFNTNFVFTPGKLTTILDGCAGSSGKGKIGSFVTQHANNWQFAICTFSPQAGHWVVLDDGKSYFYQTFPSCAYQIDRYEKLYLAPGCIIELPAFWKEIEANNIPHEKIGISPICGILQDMDAAFERGIVDFDGKPLTDRHDGTMKTGTTAHGAGACRARRVLRRKEAKYARDIPELEKFLCDVPREVMERLDGGQAGLLEVAQGFQLSYLLPEMFPYTTSRNCTVMSGLDDSMIPPVYAGNVILNFRTFPIRINSKKFIDPEGKHLTWDEKVQYEKEGKEFETYVGNSGPGYDDQKELTWEEITEKAGSPEPIMEMTSVTKLPRRIFTFSKKNLIDAMKFNRTNGEMMLSINFMNYVTNEIKGKGGGIPYLEALDVKSLQWIEENLEGFKKRLRFVGTGPKLSEQYVVEGFKKRLRFVHPPTTSPEESA